MGTFADPKFQKCLASLLEKASAESLSRFATYSNKAKINVVETRDTANPALISQFLLPLLEALGEPITVPIIRKKIRDDVRHESGTPWRRLPFWLVLRVATQRFLSLANSKTGLIFYKVLICTVLAHLLQESAGKLAPEQVLTLRQKLSRRLVKIEQEQANHPSPVTEALVHSTETIFHDIIQGATSKIELAWTNFKKSTIRVIPLIPRQANDKETSLLLPNSWAYLDGCLRAQTMPHKTLVTVSSIENSCDERTGNFHKFICLYTKLAREEEKIERDQIPCPQLAEECKNRCCDLAQRIEGLFNEAGSAYKDNPEQMSIFILNVFESWIKMDECAVKACPLLEDYHPVFEPNLLDILQLTSLKDMKKLHRIQSYLYTRLKSCVLCNENILSAPSSTSFASRYFDQNQPLELLMKKIQDESRRSRDRAHSNWELASIEYERLTKEIAQGYCLCNQNRDGIRNTKSCRKCYLFRCRRRLEVDIHEDYLPRNGPLKKAIVFDLAIPQYLAEYRAITWRIIRDLAYPSRPAMSKSVVLLLQDCPGLMDHMKSIPFSGLSLGSAKKPFKQSHYSRVKMKVDVSQIHVPFGAEFELYDTQSEIWIRDLRKPLTFQHLCGINIPSQLMTTVLPLASHPPTCHQGPSSYEIVANQTHCPSNTSIHEFTASQKLISLTTLRWPAILLELGSSNINFSSEDNMQLICQLSAQAGPVGSEGPLRQIHSVFKDESFCRRLAEQIEKRFRVIAASWRETHYAAILITLALRLFSLTKGISQERAVRVIEMARNITAEWILSLEREVEKEDARTAIRFSAYSLQVAMLCRSTFLTFTQLTVDIDESSLVQFLRATLTLQKNLDVEPDRLSPSMKAMLIRDTKLAIQLEPLIQASVNAHQSALERVILEAIAGTANCFDASFSPWCGDPQHPQWLQSSMTTKSDFFNRNIRKIRFNYLHGQLLINEKPLGRLPSYIRDSPMVQELFGNHYLRTIPSDINGMTYQVTKSFYGHQIHFGNRESDIVVFALTKNTFLELIPRNIFRKNDFDLPSPLIDQCIHWLNHRSGCVEFRRKPKIWITRPGDWKLDVRTRKARRRETLLVNPHSTLFQRVAAIFQNFEQPKNLLVYQPTRSNLVIELRNFELKFFVNNRNLLQSRELDAVIDLNQDAGTLYGLQSKIILRDVRNKCRRSIIIPLGYPKALRLGVHVAVTVSGIETDGGTQYAKFEIDDVLGRLSCPSEGSILYFKALFHAITSFPVPDPLTARTGTEEALDVLQSGRAHPWQPLATLSVVALDCLSQLSPKRDYYPKHCRSLQKIQWDPNLTSTIQQDCFEPIARQLRHESEQLLAFQTCSSKSPKLEETSHLCERGIVRQNIYIRPDSNDKTMALILYSSRDKSLTMPQANDVFQIVKCFLAESVKVGLQNTVKTMLSTWKDVIGGFQSIAEDMSSIPLYNLLEGSVSDEWGALVNLCRCTGPEGMYELMFRLSIIAFGGRSDPAMIRVLIAFHRLQELRSLKPPNFRSFLRFRKDEIPERSFLKSSMISAHKEFRGKPREWSMDEYTKKKAQHMAQCYSDSKKFEDVLLNQWPNPQPTAASFNSNVLDVKKALEAILPEWERIYANRELSLYADKVQEALNFYPNFDLEPILEKTVVKGHLLRATSVDSCLFSLQPKYLSGVVSEKSLIYLWKSLDKSEVSFQHQYRNKNSINISNSPETIKLGEILNSLASSPDPLRYEYAKDLRHSLKALESSKGAGSIPNIPLPKVEDLARFIREARSSVASGLRCFEDAAIPSPRCKKWLRLGGLWPCFTPMTILQLLRADTRHSLTNEMKKNIVFFGLIISLLQQYLRTQDAQHRKCYQKAQEEWGHVGHSNWDPMEFPDWLLLEIDNNLLIRSQQIEVARAIIAPKSGRNSVLQLNMGQGKCTLFLCTILIVIFPLREYYLNIIIQ